MYNLKQYTKFTLEPLKQVRNMKTDRIKETVKKVNKIKDRLREEKLLFGGSVETLKEKKKRLKKLEKLTDESKTKDHLRLAPNSEQYWLFNWNSKGSKIYRKETGGDFLEISKKKVLDELNEKTEEIRKLLPVDREIIMEKLGLTKKRKKKKIKNNVDREEKDGNADYVEIKSSTKRLQIPNVLVKNMTNFPMLNINSSKTNSSLDKDKVLTLPSVTKVLSSTMSDSSRAALDRWKNKMISELGEDGFNSYSQGLLKKGAQFHSCIKHHLEGTEVEVNPDVEGCWSSLQHVLTSISNVNLLECEVTHSQLLYKGIVDCVASYKNQPAVIEWKKSDKLKPELGSTYDAPLQLCAYLGALSHDHRYSNLNVENGFVVVAYSDGTPAQVFHLDLQKCLKYWNLWLQRLQKYWFAKLNASAPSLIDK